MPNIITSMDHLADLELYKTEKPYSVVVSADKRHESDVTDNLQFETHDGILVTDIRGREKEFSLETSGFVIAHHKSQVTEFKSWDNIRNYQKETESFLQRWFKAEDVVCFDVKLRKNERNNNLVRDLRDWTIPEKPALGAHTDVTFNSGITLIEFHMPDALKPKYFVPGYRFRIVNTWRTTLPVLEDSPLALCDYRSVDKNDLIACDRVIPTRAGEVYYLRYNPNHQWYWLENMTPEEPMMFIMYDSGEGDQARYCPHAPIRNPRASPSAPKRESVETRSIIITKLGV